MIKLKCEQQWMTVFESVGWKFRRMFLNLETSLKIDLYHNISSKVRNTSPNFRDDIHDKLSEYKL